MWARLGGKKHGSSRVAQLKDRFPGASKTSIGAVLAEAKRAVIEVLPRQTVTSHDDYFEGEGKHSFQCPNFHVTGYNMSYS